MIPVLSSSVLSSNKPQPNLNYDPHCHKHDMRLISDGRDKKFKNCSNKKQQNLLYIHISQSERPSLMRTNRQPALNHAQLRDNYPWTRHITQLRVKLNK